MGLEKPARAQAPSISLFKSLEAICRRWGRQIVSDVFRESEELRCHDRAHRVAALIRVTGVAGRISEKTCQRFTRTGLQRVTKYIDGGIHAQCHTTNLLLVPGYVESPGVWVPGHFRQQGRGHRTRIDRVPEAHVRDRRRAGWPLERGSAGGLRPGAEHHLKGLRHSPGESRRARGDPGGHSALDRSGMSGTFRWESGSRASAPPRMCRGAPAPCRRPAPLAAPLPRGPGRGPGRRGRGQPGQPAAARAGRVTGCRRAIRRPARPARSPCRP